MTTNPSNIFDPCFLRQLSPSFGDQSQHSTSDQSKLSSSNQSPISFSDQSPLASSDQSPFRKQTLELLWLASLEDPGQLCVRWKVLLRDKPISETHHGFPFLRGTVTA